MSESNSSGFREGFPPELAARAVRLHDLDNSYSLDSYGSHLLLSKSDALNACRLLLDEEIQLMVCHIQVWQKRDDKWNFADPWPIELLTSEQRCMEFRQALRFANRRAVNVLEGTPVSKGYDGTYELGDDPNEYRYWLEICHEYDFKYRLKR